MALSPRKQIKEHGFDRKTLMPSKTYWFLNKRLVRVLHVSVPHDIVYLLDVEDKKEVTARWRDFKRNRERAFSISAAAWVLGYGKTNLKRAEWRGEIFSPHYTRRLPDGRVSPVSRGYYSESEIYELRELFAYIHRGRPRKDGRVQSHAISEQELRYRLGEGMLLYTQGLDGEFLPVWSETI